MTKHKNDEFLKAFGKKVKAFRIAKELSQQELAIILDTDISQVNRIELGKINTTILTLSAIAKALEIKPSLLFE